MSIKAPGTQVTEVEIEEEILGTTAKIRVRLRYNDVGTAAGLPDTVIVKASLGRFPHELENAFMYPEVFAYDRVLPMLSVNAPRCYYAGIDEAGYGLVVMEDLVARGVSFCTVLSTLNYEQAAGFLDAFAAIHARWWNSKQLEAGGALDFLPATLEKSGSGGAGVLPWIHRCLEPDSWSQIVSLPRAYALPEAYRDRNRVALAVERLRSIWRLGPHCLVHGDEHLGNLFIELDGRVGLLDWQTKKAPWSETFAYFLVQALDPESRRVWEKPLLSFYLDRLRHYGTPAPAFPDAWAAYRQSVVYGLFIWLSCSVTMQSETNCVASSARFGVAAIDLDAFGALGV